MINNETIANYFSLRNDGMALVAWVAEEGKTYDDLIALDMPDDYATDLIELAELFYGPVSHSRYQKPVSYTHLTLPTILRSCRSRWSPYH